MIRAPRALFDPYCVDCNVNTNEIDEYYMVTSDVWPLEGNGMLCIGCLEQRIGRQLTPADFTSVLVNRDCKQSARLASRLSGTMSACPSSSAQSLAAPTSHAQARANATST